MVFIVLSPDGIPIRERPFKTREAAERAIPAWCEIFRAQGYYAAADGRRIPVGEMAAALSIEEQR